MESNWVAETAQERVERFYPGKNIEVSSDPTIRYNCIAWAAGDDSQWWQHTESYYWPGERGPMIRHLVSAYEAVGFQSCGMDESLEEGFEKVAIFGLFGQWTHACKQMADGRWWSKLGQWDDVKHELRDVEDETYGEVVLIMRRPVSAT